jgi:hypothetical protein
VAVCGLCGGAGASTLAFLIARSTALRADADNRPVLALDAGCSTGGLSLYFGAASSGSLAELALDIGAGRAAPTPLFATAGDGLRLIATTPRPQPEPEPRIVSRVLADAREAHRMTVVDCGALALTAERLAFESASHVVWIVPATDHGVRRAGMSPWRVVRSDVVQLLVARHDLSARRASVRALVSLADARDATLVLMPHVDRLDTGALDRALDVCGVTLQALATRLTQ